MATKTLPTRTITPTVPADIAARSKLTKGAYTLPNDEYANIAMVVLRLATDLEYRLQQRIETREEVAAIGDQETEIRRRMNVLYARFLDARPGASWAQLAHDAIDAAQERSVITIYNFAVRTAAEYDWTD